MHLKSKNLLGVTLSILEIVGSQWEHKAVFYFTSLEGFSWKLQHQQDSAH